MPRKCEECTKYCNKPNNPLKWPSIKCDTCYVSAHMCLQSASSYLPFIYEDNQSLIKMMDFKWRCHECNKSIEENKLSNIINDKIMKESIKKTNVKEERKSKKQTRNKKIIKNLRSSKNNTNE